MQGYYKNPEATREVLSEEGWFSTGDIGYVDKDNYLFITDRKKDLIKTAAGKFVAPQPIENALKTSPYILNAMVVGDRRKFIAALLVPNAATVAAKAADHGIKFTSHEELASHPWVHALIEAEVKRLTVHLAQYETIKRFAALARRFHVRQRKPHLHVEAQAPGRRATVRVGDRISLRRRGRTPPHPAGITTRRLFARRNSGQCPAVLSYSYTQRNRWSSFAALGQRPRKLESN